MKDLRPAIIAAHEAGRGVREIARHQLTMEFDCPRIALIGEPGVGKTCLVNRYVNNTFDEQFTCRRHFVTKDIIIGNIPANILVWDDEYPEPPGGPDRTKLYLSVDCCALTFDVTNAASFVALDKCRARCLRPESISEWGDLPLVVLANKIDDTANRVVTPTQVQEYCLSLGIPYFEVSAKESTNIEDAFDIITRKALTETKTLAIFPRDRKFDRDETKQ
uniref:Uncharacterized protein n=1 Tax=Ditylenchus dipsaci TaxID=166011 RepID=A0A915DYT3_9BILA